MDGQRSSPSDSFVRIGSKSVGRGRVVFSGCHAERTLSAEYPPQGVARCGACLLLHANAGRRVVRHPVAAAGAAGSGPTRVAGADLCSRADLRLAGTCSLRRGGVVGRSRGLGTWRDPGHSLRESRNDRQARNSGMRSNPGCIPLKRLANILKKALNTSPARNADKPRPSEGPGNDRK